MSSASREQPNRLVLIGHPVAHSLSPIFQGAALKSAGINASYDALDVAPEALARVLRDLSRGTVAGNVTIPHKEAVAAACSRLTDIAARVGAVNTFWHERGKLVGHNTDVEGARAAIAAVLQASSHTPVTPVDTPTIDAGRKPLSVAILGAGGAAAAVIIALEAFAPDNIVIAARTADRARALVARLGVTARIVDDARIAVTGADLVINCTPVGLRDGEFPVGVEALARGARVLDLIPRGGETAWVREARLQGHVADDGTRMLVEQGAAAFESWFGIVPDRASMWRALKAHAETKSPSQ